ncbi:DEAD-box type RNA helicase, partial [Kickxella alabastrina]
MGNVLLPGFITLCFSGDSKIRTWAWRSIKLATNKNVQTPVASVLLIFAGVLRMLAGRLDPANPYAVAKKSIEGMVSITFEFSADDIWRGLRVVLGRLTAKVKEGVMEQLDGFPTIVCKALLGIEGAEFIDAIRAFSDVISAADRSEIWPRVAQAMFCTPKDFVQFIINHPAVRDKFYAGDTTAEYSDAMLEAQNRHLRPVLEWVTPLIGSLTLPQDAPAIVALLNGLLFTVRQVSTMPLANLALAVHTAIAIVKHCFKLPTVEKFDEFGVFVLGDFLNKNLGTIVGIAQGQDPLSQSEMLITRAEELIDTMLREDLEITYDAFCQISVTAQSIRDDPAVLEEHDFDDLSTVPTLIQFPELWAAVLQNPHNTNVVNRALFAASYLMLFDPLPADLTRHLPPLWRKSYARFERKRDAIADMAKQLLQILADSLDSVDAETRMEFEREALATQLRCLVSPARSIHAVVLRILRINLLESGDGGGLENSEDSAGGGRSISELGDAERDMVCYELFNRHHEHFVDCLTGISNDCKILANFSRPAYTCAANVALLARSSISAASGLIDPGSSEAMARLFFAFCGLLASILKASSENAIQIDNRSIYMDSVLVVFQTVYNMLNAVEFSNFVRLVKGSKRLNETEAIDALSNCVARMFTYLEGDDELHVASGIVKTFGLVASGLAATPGTSMLYPIETVQGLISGRTGRLSTELRTLLRSITSQSVWEPRSISISKTKSVRIIIDDDEDAFAAMNDYDLSDILGNLDDEEQLQAEPRKASEPALLPVRQQSVRPAYESAPTPVMKPVYQPSTAPAEGTSMASTYALPAASADVGRGVAFLDISKAAVIESDDDVREIQWTAEDALMSVRRKQSSMDYWFGKPKSGGSLTSQLSQSKAAAVAAATKPRAGSTTSAATVSSTRSKKPPGGGLLGQMRSNFTKERQGLALNLPRTTPAVPKRIVQAPRAMATVSVDRWAEDRFSQTSAPPKVQPPMYVRNVSKAAIIELEKEDGAKSIELIESGDSDSASSSDEEDGGADKRGGGLAGLIKIAKAPVKEMPARRMKLLPLLGGAHGVAFGSIGGGSVFFDQQARDRAVAERKAKARLMPSMSKLHTQMLEWQYDESGDIPPQMRKSDICRIPDRFNDCDQYIKVLEPLLLLESWAQFQRAKEETLSSDIGEAILESRMSMDAFQEITYNLDLADMKELSENDILVFAESMEREKRQFQGIPAIGKSAGATTNNSGSGGNKQFAGRKTFLAMVKSRTFKRDGGQVVVRVYFEGARLATFLNILVLKSTWSFLKLFSITPIHREYAALRSLPYLNEQLVEKILQPHRANVGQVLSRTEVQECMKTHALNQPQAEAVTAAIKRDNGFTLIQGPPGTGKTKTILGLAGALLSLAKQKARREALNADPSDHTSSVAPKINNKLLICAPSNAAVDEIVKRLKCGIRNDDGRTFFPRVVRVGQSDSISSTVRDTTLDFLLDKALNAFSGGGDSNGITEDKGISDSQSSMLLEIAGRSRREGKIVTQAVSAKQDQRTAMDSQQNLRRQVNEIMAEIESLNEKMTKVESSDISTMLGLRETLHQAHQKKRALYQKLDNERARVREATRTMDATKHKVRLQILQKTDILCCTLSGSGHEILTTLNCTFDTVIIDEAAQSIELSCLIPLKYGCERCILVGDPNQLPPTVLSQTAAQYMYNQSMFVRIQKNSPQSVSLLSIQYRMHPEISVFPSRLFY